MKSIFLSIEPIHIHNEDIIELIDCSINLRKLKKISSDSPAWINYYKDKNAKEYNNLFSLKLNSYDKELFKLPDYLPDILEDINIKLILDKDLSYFMIYTEVKLDYRKLSNKKIKELFSNVDIETNLYTSIVNLLINSDTNKRSPLIDIVHKDILLKVNEACNSLYSYEITQDINIDSDTANITHFLDASKKDISNEDKKEIKLLSMNLNLIIEDKEFKIAKPLLLYGEMFYFSSKYNSVFLLNSENINRYYPIIFHMNYIRTVNLFIFNIYKEMNLNIINEKVYIPFITKERVIKNLISKLFYFKLNNILFEKMIAKNKPIIYEKVEKIWDTRESIDESLKYISKCNNFIKAEEDNYLKDPQSNIALKKKLISVENDLSVLKKVLKEYLGKNRRLTTENKEKETLKKVLKEYLGKSRKLKENTFKDVLTRADNRRKLYKDMKEYMVKGYEPFHLSFIDGDNFKAINDTYGHQAGDEVLKKIVDIIYIAIRKNELNGFVYRYGGEEFVLILFGEDNSSSLKILEEIRSNIENNILIYNDQKIEFTISLGSVKAKSGQKIDKIIEAADKLVYKAKENGRNRVEKNYK